MQFRNIDKVARPQVVTVEFERVLERDESAGAPDKMSDGFWPSQDKDSAGYIGHVSEAEFKRQTRAAQLRMNRWRGGAWYYVGVIARARIHVPIGGTSFTVYTIDSAGLWGIESDSGAYLDEVYREQLDELKEQLALMGEAFAHLFSKPEGGQ
jgi:hypothetical protein